MNEQYKIVLATTGVWIAYFNGHILHTFHTELEAYRYVKAHKQQNAWQYAKGMRPI
jgi:hypothetical protein